MEHKCSFQLCAKCGIAYCLTCGKTQLHEPGTNKQLQKQGISISYGLCWRCDNKNENDFKNKANLG